MRRAGEGYALDLHTAVRHVATAMDNTGGGWLSIAVMAASYAGASAGDLSRVRLHHQFKTDNEAIEFLVREAVAALGDQVERDGDNCRLAVSFGDLRYDGRPVHREHDPYKRLGDLFNPMLEANLSDDIRSVSPWAPPRNDAEMRELRASMQALGWLAELPGIKDERGVIIAGHRRAAIAEELGISPVFTTITFGRGDAADIRRLKLAWAANTGQKPLGAQDRRKIAAHLHAAHLKNKVTAWTQETIAEALGIVSSQIQRDHRPEPAPVSPFEQLPPLLLARSRRQAQHDDEIDEIVPAAIEALRDGRSRGEVAANFSLPNNSMKVAEAFGVARERLTAMFRAPRLPYECRNCPVHCPPEGQQG